MSPAFSFPTMDELRTRIPAKVDWLWDGYLAAGNVTLLTSRWKTGKTTLLSVLLARMAAGGTVAGRAVRAAQAVVVSEESEQHWAARDARLALGPHVRLVCRPFRGRPTADGWAALVGSLVERRAAGGLDLAVVDSLAAFLPGRSENDAGLMLDFLHPFQQFTAAGGSVLILHHPAKLATGVGAMARGSGALSGAADILVEMEAVDPLAEADRRRRLWGFARHPETPRALAIELAADGTDYAALAEADAPEHAAVWPVLIGVLEDADRKLTRQQVRERWPADHPKPSDVGLWRWLEKGVAAGRIRREGAGRRASPWVYWLPEMEAKWANDPWNRYLASLEPLPELAPLEDILPMAPVNKGKP